MSFLYTLFQSSSGTGYLYDAVTNRIFQVSDLFYKYHTVLFGALKDLNLLKPYKDSTDLLKEFLKLSNSFKSKQILCNNISADYPFKINEMDNMLNTSLQHLTLCITEACNLRCSYCKYSGHYKHSRKHSNRTMPYRTALKAINFFHSHSVASKKITISFYGGEPLIEFKKIKSLIHKCKKIFSDKEQHYQITSNGTLLDNEFIEWFTSVSDVYLNITLNGHEFYHDLYRHTPNGHGSHRNILSSISALIEKDSDAYQHRVNFLCDYAKLSDIFGIIDFYEKETLLQGKVPITLSGVHNSDHDEFISRLIDENAQDECAKCLNDENLIGKTFIGYTSEKLYEQLVEMYINGGSSNQPILKLFFDESLHEIHRRQTFPSGGNASFIGTCIPLVSRLFVNIDGKFNLCEKAGDFCDFGNVNDGCNTEKINQLLLDYKNVNEAKCNNCWAIRLCTACYTNTFTSDTIDIERRDMRCDEIKSNLQLNLALYCSMMEKSPSGLDFLDEYTFDMHLSRNEQI